MKLALWSILSLAFLFLVSCGAPPPGPDAGHFGEPPDASSAGPDSGVGDAGCASAYSCIPDPGTTDAVDCNWGSVSPNGTPSEATPLGTAASGNIYVWVNGNSIGGNDASNYFVFRSGPTSGSLSFDICFGAPISSMTATMWQVVGGTAQMPPVATWIGSSASDAGGGCTMTSGTGTPIQANTVYLFGLTAVGGAGMYGA
jgi:hypothetical protein